MAVNWTIPRESLEFVGPLHVYVDGVEITSFEVAIIATTARPNPVSSWHAPEIGRTPTSRGVYVGPSTAHLLTPGDYQVWVRITDAPEIPVLSHVGGITIT